MKIRFDRGKPGVWVSGAAHAALLAAGLVAFTADKFPEGQEGIPVEVVTDSMLSEITKGELTAKKAEPQTQPRAERQAETVQERPPGEASRDVPSPPTRTAEMKVDDEPVETAAAPPPAPPLRPTQAPVPEPPKREATKAAEAAPPPPPKREDLAKLIEKQEAEAIERARVEKSKAESEAKAAAEAAKRVAEAKAAEARAAAEAKAEADAMARAEAERQKQVAEAKAKQVAEAKARVEAQKAEAEAKAKRQAELADKFNAGDIAKLLQSKETAQSSGSTAREVQRTAALGTSSGNALRLNPSQIDSLKGLLQQQIEKCYTPPPGASGGDVVLPVLGIQFNQDGSLASDPRILRVGPKPIDRTIAEAAARAIRRCAPYRVPAQFAPYYNDWKSLNAIFELPLV